MRRAERRARRRLARRDRRDSARRACPSRAAAFSARRRILSCLAAAAPAPSPSRLSRAAAEAMARYSAAIFPNPLSSDAQSTPRVLTLMSSRTRAAASTWAAWCPTNAETPAEVARRRRINSSARPWNATGCELSAARGRRAGIARAAHFEGARTSVECSIRSGQHTAATGSFYYHTTVWKVFMLAQTPRKAMGCNQDGRARRAQGAGCTLHREDWRPPRR